MDDKDNGKISIGCDPEVLVKIKGKLIKSNNLIEDRENMKQVGIDGGRTSIEFRPKFAWDVNMVVDNLRTCITKLLRRVIDITAITNVDDIHIITQHDKVPLGGHIHFGVPNGKKGYLYSQSTFDNIAILMDLLVFTPFSIKYVNRDSLLYRISNNLNYGKMRSSSSCAVRDNYHGFEYRSLGSWWLNDPNIAKVVLGMSKLIGEYVCSLSIPGSICRNYDIMDGIKRLLNGKESVIVTNPDNVMDLLDNDTLYSTLINIILNDITREIPSELHIKYDDIINVYRSMLRTRAYNNIGSSESPFISNKIDISKWDIAIPKRKKKRNVYKIETMGDHLLMSDTPYMIKFASLWQGHVGLGWSYRRIFFYPLMNEGMENIYICYRMFGHLISQFTPNIPGIKWDEIPLHANRVPRDCDLCIGIPYGLLLSEASMYDAILSIDRALMIESNSSRNIYRKKLYTISYRKYWVHSDGFFFNPSLIHIAEYVLTEISFMIHGKHIEEIMVELFMKDISTNILANVPIEMSPLKVDPTLTYFYLLDERKDGIDILIDKNDSYSLKKGEFAKELLNNRDEPSHLVGKTFNIQRGKRCTDINTSYLWSIGITRNTLKRLAGDGELLKTFIIELYYAILDLKNQ